MYTQKYTQKQEQAVEWTGAENLEQVVDWFGNMSDDEISQAVNEIWPDDPSNEELTNLLIDVLRRL